MFFFSFDNCNKFTYMTYKLKINYMTSSLKRIELSLILNRQKTTILYNSKIFHTITEKNSYKNKIDHITISSTNTAGNIYN